MGIDIRVVPRCVFGRGVPHIRTHTDIYIYVCTYPGTARLCVKKSLLLKKLDPGYPKIKLFEGLPRQKLFETQPEGLLIKKDPL